jgi:AraC-like DNA-binding protein
VWSWTTTDDVAAGDRADWYQDLMSRTMAPCTLTVRDPEAFRAWTGTLDLGRVYLSRHIQFGLQLHRTAQLIRRSDPEHYLLGLVTYGWKEVSAGRADARTATGEALLGDTSHLFASTATGSGAMTWTVHIPRAVISLPQDRLDAALARPFSIRRGIGAIFRQFLASLNTHAAGLSPQELKQTDQAALDLATGLLAQRLDAWDRVPAETRRDLLIRRIDAFIEHHLGDPRLTPGAVADRHHISLRTLHALFRDREETVAASIRRRRLERSRSDLGQFQYSIHEVAARWGFPNPSTFAHAFRRAYGTSPRSFRRMLRENPWERGRPPAGAAGGRLEDHLE